MTAWLCTEHIEISADGSVTGKKSGNVLRDAEHEYDSVTGAFYVKDGDSTHYYAYDAASGAIGVAYGSSAVNFNEDMYLLFKKLIKSGENSVSFGSKALTARGRRRTRTVIPRLIPLKT